MVVKQLSVFQSQGAVESPGVGGAKSMSAAWQSLGWVEYEGDDF
jgi:hypothetical protein